MDTGFENVHNMWLLKLYVQFSFQMSTRRQAGRRGLLRSQRSRSHDLGGTSWLCLFMRTPSGGRPGSRVRHMRESPADPARSPALPESTAAHPSDCVVAQQESTLVQISISDMDVIQMPCAAVKPRCQPRRRRRGGPGGAAVRGGPGTSRFPSGCA